ncbi:hypothetical protein BVY04_01870 [bacterium M21]|nr:hypothetical protein BVY04_01870 [bacterium M21]
MGNETQSYGAHYPKCAQGDPFNETHRTKRPIWKLIIVDVKGVEHMIGRWRRKKSGVTLGSVECRLAPRGKYVIYEYTGAMMGDPDLTPFAEYIFDTEEAARAYVRKHCAERFAFHALFDEVRFIARLPRR